ncbi:MAG: hypothetical protein A2W03_00840 [Candidatus Aminicenantes bacterium RBG_16_63_16]|nr:MAG: hypothetical protein A2W03_00840 [Candidatus Aminicenantes bacterium RBG_16_63_16]
MNEPEDAKITKPVVKRRKYDLAAFVVMILGVVLFILTPLFIRFLKFDSDIPGILIFLIGLLMYIVGAIVRLIKKKA